MTAPPGETDRTAAALADCAREIPGLQLLLLFGSRARGDVHAGSDWDLGYLADTTAGEALDVEGLLLRLVLLLGTDQVDLVDLSRAGGLLRFRAAGFRNVVAQAYEQLDMERVYRAARQGPGDLRTFLAALRDAL